MAEKTYGYIRVSSKEQNTDRQRIALCQFGVADGDIFTDRQSGKDFDRPAYRRMVRRMKPGDVLAVKSIDRLGRNYEEILEQWRLLTKEKKVGVVVLDMPLLDTRQGRSGSSSASARRRASRRPRPGASSSAGRLWPGRRAATPPSAPGRRGSSRPGERRGIWG